MINASIIFGGPGAGHVVAERGFIDVYSQLLEENSEDIKIRHIFYFRKDGQLTKLAISDKTNIEQMIEQCEKSKPHYSSITTMLYVYSPEVLGCIIPIIHDDFGEDGLFSAACELTGHTTIFNDHIDDSMMVDKYYTNMIVAGILNANHVSECTVPRCKRFRSLPDFYKRKDLISGKVVVKPNELGGSILTSVHKENTIELLESVEEVLSCSRSVIIQSYVDGIDVTVPVLQDKDGPYVADVYSIGQGSSIYSQEAKSKDSIQSEKLSDSHAVPHDIIANIRQVCRLIMKETGLAGNVRMDFRLNIEAKKIYFLEINAIPSMRKGGRQFSAIMELDWVTNKEKPMSQYLHTLCKRALDKSVSQFSNRRDKVPYMEYPSTTLEYVRSK